MKLSRLFHFPKHRRYPIKRDREGRSLRGRCFDRFAQGSRPEEVAEELGMKFTTVCRYFRDWRRLGPNFDKQYAFTKELFKKTSPDRNKNIGLFAGTLGIAKEQFEDILSRPHGLKRFIAGKLQFPVQEGADHKMSLAFELALLISDHLVKDNGKYEDVYRALKHLIKQNQFRREDENEEIEEENNTILLMRRIMQADLENERQGQVQPERISEEERNILLKWGVQSEMKKAEATYWLRIGQIMAEGNTMEQARERVYDDVLKKGDPEAAKAMKEFRDRIHPLKTDSQ